MTDKINEEPQDAPAVVVGAPDKIWLTFGDLSEFAGGTVDYAGICRAGDISWCEDQIDKSDVQYVRADLVNQRQQQPAVEAASVPAELVRRWCRQWNDLPDPSPESRSFAEYVADKAAAYGRGQSRIDGMKKALTLIDEFADKHLEGERLAGAVQCLGVLDTAISREPPTC